MLCEVGVIAAIEQHWQAVAALGCIITGSFVDVTLHHCHGGSMKERGVHRSSGRKTSDWLVIPLIVRLHTGEDGIDSMGWTVPRWERRFRPQAVLLDLVKERTGTDVWALAAAEERGMVPRLLRLN